MHIADMNWLIVRVVDQPVFMVLVDPGALGNFKGRSPHPQAQPKVRQLFAESLYAMWEMSGIGRHVFSARVVVTLVEMDVNVAIIFEMVGHPFSVRQRCTLIHAEIVGRPAPPTDEWWGNRPGTIQLVNSLTIQLKLMMVVVPRCDHQPL